MNVVESDGYNLLISCVTAPSSQLHEGGAYSLNSTSKTNVAWCSELREVLTTPVRTQSKEQPTALWRKAAPRLHEKGSTLWIHDPR